MADKKPGLFGRIAGLFSGRKTPLPKSAEGVAAASPDSLAPTLETAPADAHDVLSIPTDSLVSANPAGEQPATAANTSAQAAVGELSAAEPPPKRPRARSASKASGTKSAAAKPAAARTSTTASSKPAAAAKPKPAASSAGAKSRGSKAAADPGASAKPRPTTRKKPPASS